MDTGARSAIVVGIRILDAFDEGFHDPGVIGVSLHWTRPPVAGGTVVQDSLDIPFLHLNTTKGHGVADGVEFEDLCGLSKDNLVAKGETCGTGYIHQVSITLTLEHGDPKAGGMHCCFACDKALSNFCHPTLWN